MLMPEHSIVLPSKPKVIKEEDFFGTYEIDGLYPGYGHTLGNSLRRIILSSLPGAAVTSVKIDGVSHEFSTLEGVKEDVITMLLNIKKIRIRLLTEEPQTMTLSIKGPKEVYAKDLEHGSQIEILNPEQRIASITGKVNVEMELVVERGLGYVPKEVLSKERVEIGSIVLDAIFTPIRRATYEVENMRVGNRTDFNKLRVSIETDGTISPRDALEQSIMIMVAQLKAVVGFEEGSEEEKHEEPHRYEKRKESSLDPEALKTRIENLDLSQRTMNALVNANIRTLGGLTRKKEDDLSEIDGLGNKGIQEIKRVLSHYGISLK